VLEEHWPKSIQTYSRTCTLAHEGRLRYGCMSALLVHVLAQFFYCPDLSLVIRGRARAFYLNLTLPPSLCHFPRHSWLLSRQCPPPSRSSLPRHSATSPVTPGYSLVKALPRHARHCPATLPLLPSLLVTLSMPSPIALVTAPSLPICFPHPSPPVPFQSPAPFLPAFLPLSLAVCIPSLLR
jgi:hypothetical protein